VNAELVLGGARSGKSRYALDQALAHSGPVCWVATAEAFDAEMQARIQHHRAERPSHWQSVEAPLQLAAALHAQAGQFVVIDCLTLWLSNWLCRDTPADWQVERAALVQAVADFPSPLKLVSNEVGYGIVPDNALARHFRDEAGRLHQDLAALCPAVTLVVAGLPMAVKRTSL